MYWKKNKNIRVLLNQFIRVCINNFSQCDIRKSYVLLFREDIYYIDDKTMQLSYLCSDRQLMKNVSELKRVVIALGPLKYGSFGRREIRVIDEY